jgi:hypothetical protein
MYNIKYGIVVSIVFILLYRFARLSRKEGFSWKNFGQDTATFLSGGLYKPPPPPPPPTLPPTLAEQIAALDQQISGEKKNVERGIGIVDGDNITLSNLNDILAALEEQQRNAQAIIDAPGRIANNEVTIAALNNDKIYFQGLLDAAKQSLDYTKNLLNDTDRYIIQKKADYTTLNTSKILFDSQLSLNAETIKDESSNITNLIVNINDLNFQMNNLIYLITESDISVNNLNNSINDLTIKIWSNQVYNNQNILSLSNAIDASLNHLFKYLKKDTVDYKLLYEKINYRAIEHQKLYNINKIFDILFYCFYFAFLLIIICTRTSKKEHFLIYLFIALIPYIYPYLFKFSTRLNLKTPTNGPKSSFTDINNTIFKKSIQK